MARLSLPVHSDTCPLFRAAALQMEGQRARIHAVGEGERTEIDVNCIGPNCMAYVTTGLHPKTQKPIGGCGIAVGPVYMVQLNRNIEALNAKIDTLIISGVEAAEAAKDREGPYSFLGLLAAKLKSFFAAVDDAPATTDKSKLEGIDSRSSRT